MACTIDGHPDMYGVGIRVAFYLLWFAVLLASWLAPRETAMVRNVLLTFILAAFLALVIQVGNGYDGGTLRAVEVYLVLLLVYGTYYAFLPLYLWRLVTGCSPFWDPSRWPRVPSSRTWALLNILALLGVSVFQLWFWITGLDAAPVDAAPCDDEHAFFFAEVPLKNQLFIALNIIVSIVLLLGCVLEICFAARILRNPKWLRRKIKKARKRGISDERRVWLELLHGTFRAVVASLLIVAVELTIQWNNIRNVSDATSAAQLIPLVVAAGITARIFWVALVRRGDDDDSGSEVVVTEEYVRRTVEESEG